jgi:hypothetical protein
MCVDFSLERVAFDIIVVEMWFVYTEMYTEFEYNSGWNVIFLYRNVYRVRK